MRPFIIGLLVWLGLTIAASALGGILSLYTGDASELPQWNGWTYFLFGVAEGALFGAMFTWLIALLVFVIAWACFRDHDVENT
jgi:hypothetical protein